MTLRRAAFPHKVGSRLFTVYLLWLEACDLHGHSNPHPLLSDQAEELEQIVGNLAFQEALAQLPSGTKVEVVPSVQDRFYVRVLTPLVGKAAKQDVISLPVSLPLSSEAA